MVEKAGFAVIRIDAKDLNYLKKQDSSHCSA